MANSAFDEQGEPSSIIMSGSEVLEVLEVMEMLEVLFNPRKPPEPEPKPPFIRVVLRRF